MKAPPLGKKEYQSHPSYYYLFPPQNPSYYILRPMLQEAQNLFRRTFNHLQSRQDMSAVASVQLPSRKPTFSNLTISFPVRPMLLNPSLVAQAVSQHILPNRRNRSTSRSLLHLAHSPSHATSELTFTGSFTLNSSYQPNSGVWLVWTRPNPFSS